MPDYYYDIGSVTEDPTNKGNVLGMLTIRYFNNWVIQELLCVELANKIRT